MAKTWTEAELVAAIEQEESTAINWMDGPLADERAEALRRFNREPYGNEIEGRSQVVASDVSDAVEGVMPTLARIFMSGDEVGKFDPVSPEDKGYEVESQCVNWYINTKNDGFSVLYAALKDALLLGNSYIKAWWAEREDVVVERYTGLSDEEATILMQDEDVEVVEHTEYPDPSSEQGEPPDMGPELDQMGGMGEQQPQPPRMLHDIKVERVRPDEYVQICAVPPDEVLVSSHHREVSLANADFVQHRRALSIGEIRELGYDIDDDIADDQDDANRPEFIARQRYQERLLSDTDDATAYDPTRRRVTLRETWIRLAMGGKKQTLWRICMIGKKIIHKEEADMIPLASFSPILYPHSHAGISYFSMVADIAELNTTVWRQYLDNLYLQNNSRMVVDVTRVNIDDLLVSRPGGIVRGEGNPNEVLAPIVTPDVGGAALQAMEFLASVKENRTGTARVNQGTMDPNALNRTATGASLMMSAGQSRLELIARCLASGVKDLFLLVHAIALKHSTKPLQIRLNNQFVVTNPREWQRRTDYTLTVALGTGAPEQQAMKMQNVMALQEKGMAMGICGPDEVYNAGKEYLKVIGFRNADLFIKEPMKDPQTGQSVTPPPQKDPIVQAEEIKQQGAMQKAQMDAQMKGQELQLKAQTDAQNASQQLQLQRENDQRNAMLQEREYQLEVAKMEREFQFRQWEKEQDVKLEMWKEQFRASHQAELAQQQMAHDAEKTKYVEQNRSKPN